MVDHQTEHHCSACPRMLIGKGHLTHKYRCDHPRTLFDSKIGIIVGSGRPPRITRISSPRRSPLPRPAEVVVPHRQRHLCFL